MGDGRAEGSSEVGDGGQAAISLMPDVDGMHVRIFRSSQLEGSYVGDLLYFFSIAVRVQNFPPCLTQGLHEGGNASKSLLPCSFI